ncbi:MAG TPA: WhiB family transcriptional regulator, partial [Streptosporangiaceae bacterium]|nr:WhiB family transcriptional regulator [Streptosporangiaceae bacterium]
MRQMEDHPITRPRPRRPRLDPITYMASRDVMEPADLTDDELKDCVMSPLARCSASGVDPDEWFPITSARKGARLEASRALAVCNGCPVRAECLEVSMRFWFAAGRHGVWGGYVEAERSDLRRDWLAGVPVRTLLGA